MIGMGVMHSQAGMLCEYVWVQVWYAMQDGVQMQDR